MKQLYKLAFQFAAATIISLASISTSFAQCTPAGDQVTYGTNNVWIGYVYQGRNFNHYRGSVTEGTSANPGFDENFGGSYVNYATNNGCDVQAENFSVRYKLAKSFSQGYYDITVGGDDGYRLSIDGGATWTITNWNNHSYTSTTQTIWLNGSHNLVLEYYENGGDNRVTFSIGAGCNPAGNPAAYGSNNTWIGYLYQGINFNNYKGFVTEGSGTSPNFDESFGGSYTSFGTSSCGVQTESFSARFRLTRFFPAGSYSFVVGGDDGYRLSFDGGATWAINNWNLHSYTASTISVNLSGTVNMVLEYYENFGENRVTFAMTANGSLPVKLTGFTAKAMANDKVQLNWKVSEEMNFSHYVVQRSTGGSEFKDLAIIGGQDMDVQKEITYAYTDRLTYSGLVHYRLKMVDKDATAKYSSVVTVSLNVVEGSAKVYPTLVESGDLYIETAEKLAQGKVEIVDMNGRIMLSLQNITGNRSQVSLGKAQLAPGTYLVRVTNGNKLVVAKKVMVK